LLAHTLLLIFALLALGLLLQRLLPAPAKAAAWLNALVLYACLPAAVLRFAPRVAIDASALAIVAIPWLLLLATLPLVSATTRWLRLRRDEHAVLLLTVALGNTSFLGYPLVRALRGDAAMPHAVLYDQLGAFLMLSTFGLWVLARYGHAARAGGSGDAAAGVAPPGFAAMALRVLRFPPFLALLFGFGLMPAEPPAIVALLLRWLSDAMLPIAMLAIGLGLQLRLPRDELRPLAAGLTLKLVAIPLLSVPIALSLGLHGPAFDVAVLESAMPPMITAAALAMSQRLAPGLAAAMAAHGLVLSLLTVPLWAWGLRTLAG
jgi:hypothetical protein